MTSPHKARRTRSAPAGPWRKLQQPRSLDDAAAESLAATYTVVWQVQINWWGTWCDYDKHLSDFIEQAWSNLQPTVRVGPTHNPDQWLIHFDRLIQQNEDTDTVRNIRRMLVTNR